MSTPSTSVDVPCVRKSDTWRGTDVTCPEVLSPHGVPRRDRGHPAAGTATDRRRGTARMAWVAQRRSVAHTAFVITLLDEGAAPFRRWETAEARRANRTARVS
ncbi:hypothetical protein OG225_10010 [Nocardia sp. NBC_01377]|uniref:hypothetical protein n=1 Tax=Nocardia sp. NBC_01377 TaxID=2903595 RepID=UPI00324C0A03